MQLPEIIFQLIVEFSWPHFFGSVIMQPSLIILHLQKMRIISSSDVDMLRLSGVALSSKVYLHTLCGLLFSLNYPHCHSLVETSLHPSSTLEGACPKLDSTTQNPLWSIPAWKCQHTLFFFPSGYAPYWQRKIYMLQTLPGSMLFSYLELDKSFNFHFGVKINQLVN